MVSIAARKNNANGPYENEKKCYKSPGLTFDLKGCGKPVYYTPNPNE